MKRVRGGWWLTPVITLLLAIRPAFADKVRLTIVSEPAGANIEWNGRFVGTTPYETQIEDYAVKAPRYLWSKYLGEEIVLRVWKDGYQPKMVALTSGPFTWVNLNNTARKIYYLIESPSVRVLLESDSRVDVAARNAAASTAVATPPTMATTTGTGFIVSATGYVATNYHVVKGAEQIELRIPGSPKAVVATVAVKDVGNDLALLKADGMSSPPSTIRFAEASAVKVGQDTFTLGYPLGDLMGTTVRLSTGTIDSLFGVDDDPRVYQISNPVQPGNSGGPLFNKDGQLVGIVVAQLDAKVLYEVAGIIPQNVNFAVKASLLKNLMDTLPDRERIVAEANPLQGAAREKQIDVLSPLVVEIVAHRPAAEGRARDTPARVASTPPTIEGLSEEQVLTILGRPSLTHQDPDGVTTWYYDGQSTLKIFFFGGRASLRRQR